MSEVARLAAAFESGDLLHPSADVLNVVDLARAIAVLAGAEDIQLTPGVSTLVGRVGRSDHLVFVIADGLGSGLLKSVGANGFLSRHLIADLRTVFPSTTPAVLTTLATGEWPGKHAALGWDMYLPEIGSVSTIIRFLRRSDDVDLGKLGLTPELVFPLPSMRPRFRRDTLSLLPAGIADSAYSKYASGGTARRGYKTLAGAIDRIATRVAESTEPTCTFLYWPYVDTACHENGTRHGLVRHAVQELDRELDRLARALSGKGRLVVSADHGLLDADDSQSHLVEKRDEMLELLVGEPSGDARVAYFHLQQGGEAQFRRLFKGRFGDRFVLLSVDEGARLGLFGPDPLSALSRRRLGDLMAVSMGADTLFYERSAPKNDRPPGVSHHSGLTPSEMLVPLIVA